ncbi:hypothetical protein F5144DRAFT_173676 [Chaetomium tenue]|uniref:Uncharacterized protein n=1 Tax=Chaetomium tenue TaxID=1854479 RepID=A0ACB7PDC2_9PEZI|nr:hypothetical protein F5144DRAFT_173676 [Chaetomium globosum]
MTKRGLASFDGRSRGINRECGVDEDDGWRERATAQHATPSEWLLLSVFQSLPFPSVPYPIPIGTNKLKPGKHSPACCPEGLYARPEPSSVCVCLVIARSSRAAQRGNHLALLKNWFAHHVSCTFFARLPRIERREARARASICSFVGRLRHNTPSAVVDEYTINMDGVWLPRPSILQVPAVHAESHTRPQNSHSHSALDAFAKRGRRIFPLSQGPNLPHTSGLEIHLFVQPCNITVKMPGEEFITLHEAQPQRPPYNPAVNRPAVLATPGYQGQVGQQPPRTVNAGGQQYHPQSPVGQQQYYTTPVSASTPQWRQRQYATAQPDAHVEISDLRKERPLTNEEAREKEREAHSQYCIIRIVRDEGGRHASDGTRRKPSWARVQFRPDPSTTKKEAARAVRKLDQTTTSVTEKKRDLTEDQRRQVELVLLRLRKKWDDETFETELVQLDDELEEKPKENEWEGETERERRNDKHRKEDAGQSGAARVPSKPHSKPHSKSKQPKKTTTERVSITAYFKRAPRLEIDPFSIPPPPNNAQHNIHTADMQQAYPPPATQPVNGYYPPPPQHNVPPPQMNNPPPQQGIPPSQLNNPPPQPPPRPTETRNSNPAHQAQAYAQNPRTGPGQAPPRRPPNSPARRASFHQRSPLYRRPSSPIRKRARSPLSTDESASSKVFSDADDDTDYTSPSTPSYTSNRDFFDRPRQNSRYRESPAHYGIQPKFPRGKPQREVHIQPHRSHERRPDLGERQHTIPVLNQQPLPRHMSNPAPGPGFPRPMPGHANMTDAAPPVAASQPPTAQVPTGPRPTGPAQFPPPPPGAQSQGPPPGHNPTAFPSQPNPTPPPGQHNPGPVPGQHGQGFPAAPGSHPPPNMAPRGPGPMNGMNGMGQMNPNQPVNLAGNPANGPNPAMHPRHPGNTEGNPSQIPPPQNPALNPTALYATAYARGRADIHEEALHMAERVAERVVAAAVPPRAAEGRRRGASPVVIQEDRGRGRAGRDRDRDRDDYDNRGRARSPSRSPSRSASRSRSPSRSPDRDRHTRDRRRERSRSVDRRRDHREGGERNRGHEQRHRDRHHGHGARLGTGAGAGAGAEAGVWTGAAIGIGIGTAAGTVIVNPSGAGIATAAAEAQASTVYGPVLLPSRTVVRALASELSAPRTGMPRRAMVWVGMG